MVDDQVRPLAVAKPPQTTKPRCNCKICSLVTLLFLIILITTIIVLIFTVFKVKPPTMTLNKITLDFNTTTGPAIWPASNISMTADVSVKNPNIAIFRFGNTTSSISYKGIMMGEAHGPSGKALASRTMRMNITVEIITSRIIMAPNLSNDILILFLAFFLWIVTPEFLAN